MTEDAFIRQSVLPRVVAHIAFWICLLPVLMGAMTLGLIPMRVRHERVRLETPGASAEHQADARRRLAVIIGNGVVRAAAVPLLIGFLLAGTFESRALRVTVFVSAIVLAIAHLLIPLAHGSTMAAGWRSPLYYLPAIAAALSGLALWSMREPPPGP